MLGQQEQVDVVDTAVDDDDDDALLRRVMYTTFMHCTPNKVKQEENPGMCGCDKHCHIQWAEVLKAIQTGCKDEDFRRLVFNQKPTAAARSDAQAARL